MKKLTLCFASLALFGPLGVTDCLADYKDMAEQVETVADFWLGGTLNDTSSSLNEGMAERYSLKEAGGRVGTNHASEFYALKSSASGGFLIKSAPLPNRFHLELDYYNDKDWFGDLRYSYKDYLQIRLLPRRLTHNLDNLTVFDFAPLATTTSEIEIKDRGIEDYGLRVDIDQYRVRLKTPNFPLHVYSEGEVVRKTGQRQLRFLGGAAYFSGGTQGGRVRVTEARDIDQETKTVTIGTNAHLGPVEFDLSTKQRKFKSDESTPVYNYQIDLVDPTKVAPWEHNVLPTLKATTNTVKVHTSHTGRIFASATFSELEKNNETSGAEAKSSLSYGEISWVPVAYFTLGAKLRHQKNDGSAPATTKLTPDSTGTLRNYTVYPAVVSQTDTAIVTARYSMISKSNLNFQYTRQVKELEGDSAIVWNRPEKTAKDIYDVSFTNWAIPKVRTTAKFNFTKTNDVLANSTYEPVNNDPYRSRMGNVGVTWLISPRVAAFANASMTKEESDLIRVLGIPDDIQSESLNQQYMLSMSFAVNEKFSISPAYTYMSWEQKRGIVWEYSYEKADTTPDLPLNPDGTSAETETRHVVDTGYTSKQKAQNYAINLAMKPSKRLNINGVIEYTITKGTYDPTSPLSLSTRVNDGVVANTPFNFFTDKIGELSQTDTKEFNLRLDSEYDLGRGWGLGLNLRYVDWQDTSTDNPSDGVYYGGLFKVTKKLFY